MKTRLFILQPYSKRIPTSRKGLMVFIGCSWGTLKGSCEIHGRWLQLLIPRGGKLTAGPGLKSEPNIEPVLEPYKHNPHILQPSSLHRPQCLGEGIDAG